VRHGLEVVSSAVAIEREPMPQTETALARFARFEDVVELVRQKRDIKLLVEIEGWVRLVSYKPGRIEFQPADNAPTDLAQRMSRALQNWTGVRWVVTIVSDGGGETISEQNAAVRNNLIGQVSAHPLVQAALDAFPGAEISDVKQPEEINPFDLAVPIDDEDDDWDPLDPFEEN